MTFWLFSSPVRSLAYDVILKPLRGPKWSKWIIQTEAERRRREAGVKQSMEIRVGSCMYVSVCVWYLELSAEPRHLAQW
jgi:hypothetical protein